MLDTFIVENREELIRLCQDLAGKRASSTPSPLGPLTHGVPRFLDQMVETLRNHPLSDIDIDTSAAQHGHDLHERGFSLSQVVHDYGDVCQSITDLALR